MKEIWEQVILSYNMPLTALFVVMLLFWFISLVGAFDFDFDADVNLDPDGAEITGGDGVLGFLLRAVNAYDIPVMLVLSLLSLFTWMIAIVSNYFLNPNGSGWVALGLFLVNFIVSVVLVKITTQPLRPLFRAIKNDKEHQEPLMGSTGSVKSRTLDQGFGQCEVIRPKGAPALLNCKLCDGEDALMRGDEILVVGYEEESQKYLIKPLKNKES